MHNEGTYRLLGNPCWMPCLTSRLCLWRMAWLTTGIWLVGIWRSNRTIYLGNNRNLEGNSLMDIFEEIKEAVLTATPGEDTRNYYRNQGMKIEQDRIISLLTGKYAELTKASRYADSNYYLQIIQLIKGDN